MSRRTCLHWIYKEMYSLYVRFMCLPCWRIMFSQLTPLCTPAHGDLFLLRLLVMGYVDSVNKIATSFKVVTFDWLQGGTFRDQLTIFVLLDPANQNPMTVSRLPNARGLVFFSGVILMMKNTTVTLAVDAINLLNQKAQSTPKVQHTRTNTPACFRLPRPASATIWNVKKKSHNTSLEALFEKERDFFSSD